jgi:hypothetical protein
MFSGGFVDADMGLQSPRCKLISWLTSTTAMTRQEILKGMSRTG